MSFAPVIGSFASPRPSPTERVRWRSRDVCGRRASPYRGRYADPESVAGVQVSLREYIESDPAQPIDFVQLGEHAARLHRLAPDRLTEVVPLPVLRRRDAAAGDGSPARAAEALDVLDRHALAALRAAWRRVADWAERARREEPVVCHGDLHPDNVLMRGPELVIIDWDAVCLGPPAWDHAALLPWEERRRTTRHLHRLRTWRRSGPPREPAGRDAGCGAPARRNAQCGPDREARSAPRRRSARTAALLAR